MHRLRLFGCRGLARANRPHRLVRDHAFVQRLPAYTSCDRTELPLYHALRLSCLALLQRLTDAQDRSQPCGNRRLILRGDRCIILTEQGAPLRMADDHVSASEVTQHGGGNLAGVSPFGMLTHVLRAPAHRARDQQFLRLSKIRKWHTDANLRPSKLARTPDDRV